MKKIIYTALAVILAAGLSSCSQEKLNTSPTDSVTGEGLFENATAALMPLNGIYRSMYTAGWSTSGGGNSHQCFGISAYNMTGDVMGEDFIQDGQGSGWFWYDCIYDVKGMYTSGAWRPYDLWNAYYTWISNANYIIAAKETMTGTPTDINYVIGQAYAIRAYSYFMLAQWYARTYVGHETEKGVPVYTEPTIAGTEGQPRGTLNDTYAVINADIDTAIARLSNSYAQTHASHIDMYVANGIKARICMVQERWEEALECARIAQQGGAPTAAVTGGMNDVGQSDVLWGAEIIPDQSGIYASFMMHMVEDGTDGYGNTARKLISADLYNRMNPTDIRRGWWNPDATYSTDTRYQQVKFQWSNKSTYEADYIWMRTPEFILTEAEALCRLGRDGEAQQVLNSFMQNYRDPNYNTGKTGTALGALTTDYVGSLLEEILIQRRIELWGEYGRIFDIRRLKQGFQRTEALGWPAAALLTGLKTYNPESWDWVMTIPQAEFDANHALTADDQNPRDSGI